MAKTHAKNPNPSGVELEPGVDVWTLFIPGPKLKEWGFIDKGIWKHHKKYLSERYKG